MKKTILVVGFGPGISTAVAEKFGAAGFAVGLVARSGERLAAGVKALADKGIEARAFTADAGDPEAIRATVEEARTALGPITVLSWTAYGGNVADLTSAKAADIRGVFDVAVVGLLTAVQEALPDLEQSGKGAVLVVNGAFGEDNPQVDAFAVKTGNMGLALANAAKHKLVGLLSERLRDGGVFVGEVMVAGTVKGTAWDKGNATLEAANIAKELWDLYEARGGIRARVA